jgi:hypothetical protein
MHEGLEQRLTEARKLRPKTATGADQIAVDVLATAHLAKRSAARSSRV